MDATKTPLSTSPSLPLPSLSYSSSLLRHFYLAVDRPQFKMDTLVDLLGTAGRRPCLPVVVCFSTRNELDAICSNVSNLPSYISVSSPFRDLPEAHRAEVMDNFRRATLRWNKLGREDEADGEADKENQGKSHIIVVTDAFLFLVLNRLLVLAF